MHDHRPRHDEPPGWTVLLQGFLETTPAVSRRLWQQFEGECSVSTRYLLENCMTAGYGAPPEQILLTLTPRRLLALTLAVAPETGRPRDRAIVDLEAKILACMRPPARSAPWYA